MGLLLNHCSKRKYRQGRFLPASGHDSFANPSIHSLVLGVCLFKDIFPTYIIDSPALDSRHLNSHLRKARLTRIFSMRHITAFLRWGTADSPGVQHCAWATLNSAKYRSVENVILHRPQKGHLCTAWVDQGGRVSPYSTSGGNMPVGRLTFFCCFVHACKWPSHKHHEQIFK